MSTELAKLETVFSRFSWTAEAVGGLIRVDTGPDGLESAWIKLPDPDCLFSVMEALRDAGCRLSTTTVYRPKADVSPRLHEIAYHMQLGGLPVTLKLAFEKGTPIPSITALFANANWEERELMELSDIAFTGHPEERRLFLDESVEAGVFDRYVPFSELTNTANAEAVWKRIREESQREKAQAQAKDVVA